MVYAVCARTEIQRTPRQPIPGKAPVLLDYHIVEDAPAGAEVFGVCDSDRLIPLNRAFDVPPKFKSWPRDDPLCCPVCEAQAGDAYRSQIEAAKGSRGKWWTVGEH